MSSLSATNFVPYRHRVSAVAGIAPLEMRLDAPLNPYAKTNSQNTAGQANSARGGYNANSAGAGFAAAILVEAGLAGDDPFAGTRGAKAYDNRRPPITSVRLVA
jgi:hypothetical protein